MRILIIEDDKKVSDTLSKLLTQHKHSYDLAEDGESGLDLAMSGNHNLILLDLMLPQRGGIDILRTIRSNGLHTPVIVVSAKNELADKVAALDAGADDYLTKPFYGDELMARIRAISRRGPVLSDDRLLTFGDLTLDLSTYRLSCQKNSTRLGLKELNITELLMRGGKRICSKEELLVKVWGYDTDAEYNNVEVFISNLRKKLRTLGSTVNIATVRGVGYHLE